MWSNSKIQILTKFKNLNCDKTQKLKWWQNLKTKIVIKLKLKMWQNSTSGKTQVATKLKLWQKSSCDKTQFVTTQFVTKLKLWQNSSCDKIRIVTKLENSNDDKTQKFKLWQNLKKKLKFGQNLKYDNSQFMKTKKTLKGSFSKTFWHLDSRWDVLWAAFCDTCLVSCVTCHMSSVACLVLHV